jgi:chloride channel 3/4/5
MYGAFFIKMNVKFIQFRRSSRLAKIPITEIAILSFVTAFVSFPFKFLRVSTGELVENLFRECTELDYDFNGLCSKTAGAWSIFPSLLFTAFVKIGLTVVTFGAAVPAGIFIPSMAVGACVGRVIGMFVNAVHQAMPDSSIFSACPSASVCVTPGTYAGILKRNIVIGAAASLAGVTRMTVSLVVIMFELTGALSYSSNRLT